MGIKTKINLASILAIIGAAIIIFGIPMASAGEGITGAVNGMIEQLDSGCATEVKKALTNESGDNALYNYVVSDTSSDNMIVKIQNIMFGFGIAFSLVFGAARFFQKLDRGMDSQKAILKTLQELCIVTAILLNIGPILGFIVKFGNFIIQTVTEAGDTVSSSGDLALSDAIYSYYGVARGENFGMLDGIGAIMILLIPYLLSLVTEVAGIFVSYTLLVEIGIRRAFSTLAIADIYGEGLRSPGVRYLRRYLAVYVKIALALFACYMGRIITGTLVDAGGFSSVSGMVSFLIKVAAANLAVLGIMVKGGEAANDIVGG